MHKIQSSKILKSYKQACNVLFVISSLTKALTIGKYWIPLNTYIIILTEFHDHINIFHKWRLHVVKIDFILLFPCLFRLYLRSPMLSYFPHATCTCDVMRYSVYSFSPAWCTVRRIHVYVLYDIYLGPLLITWINLNLNRDKQTHAL